MSAIMLQRISGLAWFIFHYTMQLNVSLDNYNLRKNGKLLYLL